LRSTLFTKVDKNNSTSSPNARPQTLGKGRPMGASEIPPVGSARPWVKMGYHGTIWASMGFRNKTMDFLKFRPKAARPHHIVAMLRSLTRASTNNTSAAKSKMVVH
jgi:hypothetical protein